MQWVDKVFGVSPQVLAVRSQRFEMIAANLANADTPGYKAIDRDFTAALAAVSQVSGELTTTSDRHISMEGAGSSDAVQYRIPMQPSMDGNTVETDVERSAFMDNSIRYQASLNFLDSRIKGILGAIRGE